MRLELDGTVSRIYKSNSQKARIITERWIAQNMYCSRCGCETLQQLPNNTPVSDFLCPQCQNIFELKATRRKLGKKIDDGAYATMIQRIHSTTNPDFLFMSYNLELQCINQLIVVPKFYFTDAVIEKRKPLSSRAKRAGWTGCNILLGNIPVYGRIAVIQDKKIMPKNGVCRQYQQTNFIGRLKMQRRGWILDILKCLERIPQNTFSLADMYHFARDLQQLHPENQHIEAKIRQQLQVLRDHKIIEFLGRGQYRKVMTE